MAERLTPEQRRQALRDRQQRSQSTKDSGGFGAGVIDLAKVPGRKITRYEPKMGRDKNLVDLIPFIVEEEWYAKLKQPPSGETMTSMSPGMPDYGLHVPVHKGVGPDKRAMVCPRAAFGKKCFICEERFAEFDKDEPDEEKTRDLKESWRSYYTVYDYDEPDKDFQLWPDQSWHMFEKLMLDELDSIVEGAPVIGDPIEGVTVEFRGKEKQLGKNKFMEAQSFEFLDREPYSDDVYDDAFPLDQMLIVSTYEDTKRAYLGLDDEEALPTGRGVGDEGPPSRDRGTTRQRPARDRGGEAERPRTQQRPTRGRGGDTPPPDDEPENKCPAGGAFGVDANELPECNDCPDNTYNECVAIQDEAKGQPEPEPEPEPEKETPTRTRGRGRSAEPEPEPESGGRTRSRQRPQRTRRSRG